MGTFNTDDVKIYIAAAGAGKSTALMNELEVAIKTVRPEEIAFSTFTRKGVETGLERAKKLLHGLKDTDLPFFKTLHSLCFRESGMKHGDILEYQHIKLFNKALGFNLSPNGFAFHRQTEDDKLLARYDAERGGAKRGIVVQALFDEERYYRFVRTYEKFKKDNDLNDFYDCLLRYNDVGQPLPVAVFLLDEWQDATPLQMDVVKKASANAQTIRVAGDPSQAIFSYNGADPRILINLAKEYETVKLDLSYRLPRKVCLVADSIVDIMDVKIPTFHKAARDVAGEVKLLSGPVELARLVQQDYKVNANVPDRWFILHRTNGEFGKITNELERYLIPYHYAHEFCLNDKVLAVIEKKRNLTRKGYEISKEAKDRFMSRYGIIDLDQPFLETNIVTSERKYVYDDYLQAYGIDQLRAWAKGRPFCTISTTHKQKGAEADNVAVILDATKQVSQNILFDLDSELRVMYVACTRTKDKLYIIQPSSKNNLMSMWDGIVENMGGLAKEALS